jgi:hypothetical protein
MNNMRTIDIAHPPLSSKVAEEVLDKHLREYRLSKNVRMLKIIHGHGSSPTKGSLKNFVLDWAYTNRKQIRAIIEGDHYNAFDKTTQEMRKECGQTADADLGASNHGMTVLWIK